LDRAFCLRRSAKRVSLCSFRILSGPALGSIGAFRTVSLGTWVNRGKEKGRGSGKGLAVTWGVARAPTETAALVAPPTEVGPPGDRRTGRVARGRRAPRWAAHWALARLAGSLLSAPVRAADHRAVLGEARHPGPRCGVRVPPRRRAALEGCLWRREPLARGEARFAGAARRRPVGRRGREPSGRLPRSKGAFARHRPKPPLLLLRRRRPSRGTRPTPSTRGSCPPQAPRR
jgi:hypothetical protein